MKFFFCDLFNLNRPFICIFETASAGTRTQIVRLKVVCLTNIRPQAHRLTTRERLELPNLLRPTVFKTASSSSRIRVIYCGDGIRTHDFQLMRLATYPLIHPAAGVVRFELTTSWSQTRRATKLRYTPMNLFGMRLIKVICGNGREAHRYLYRKKAKK